VGVKDAWKALFQGERAPKNSPMRGEVGMTGNKMFSGLPMDEYNPDLAFPKSIEVYDQMRRSDGQIGAVLNAIKLPIRSAKWYVEPNEDAKDEKLAEQIAEFIEDNLMGGMAYSWDDHLREALLMLDFGFSVFEKVYKFDTWQNKPVIMLDKYAPRVAPSIWRFPQDEETGDVVAVEQLNYYTGQLFSIPLTKCRLYTYNREGDNPAGISLLRQAYKHWYYKDSLYRIMAVGVEKSLVGTPYATMPKGASEQDKNSVLAVISAIRSAEEAGFTIPEGVILGMLEGTKNAVDAMPLMEHHDTLIARSVLGQFLNLGTMSSASGGSFALGQTQVSLFLQGLEAIANYIQGEIQHDIEQLVEWNFGKDAPVPQLKHGLITIESVSERMTAIAALGAGHLVNPDESLENYLRSLMGLPPITKATLDNQLLLPANRYEPEIIPNKPLTPQMAADAAKAQAQAKAPGIIPGATAIKASESDTGFTFADDGPKTTGGGQPPAQTGKWKRELTALESEDMLVRLSKEWQEHESQWQSRLATQQQTAAKDLVDQVRQVVMAHTNKLMQMNDVNSLKVPVDMQAKYQQQIEQLLTQSYETGTNSTAAELGTTSPTAIDAEVTALISAKAQLLAGVQLGKLTDGVKFAVIDQLTRNHAVGEVVTAARQAAATFIDGNDLKTSGMVSIGEALNIGRGVTAKAVGVKGAQWSAVLDDHTCPLCESLDGKNISAENKDFDIFRPPLHIGCRCILVYIGSNNTGEVYNWVTPSPELVKKYGHLVS